MSVKKKIIVGVTAVIIAVVAGIIGVVVWRSSNKVLDLMIAPNGAMVLVDGRDYTGKSSIVVTPGAHEINVSMFGFDEYYDSFDVTDDMEVKVALTPNMEFVEGWYVYNPEDAAVAESISQDEKRKAEEEILTLHPNLNKLPVVAEKFSLTKESCQDVVESVDLICVMILASNANGVQDAIDYFRENIDEKVGDYYFRYKNVDVSILYSEELSSILPPAPSIILDGGEYGGYVFMLNGLPYRALYFWSDVMGEWLLSGEPAPFLTYTNFVGKPEWVIDAINNVRMGNG